MKERLSLNQITTNRWSVAGAAEGCARAGIGWIGLWREKVAEAGGAAGAAAVVRDAGLRVSSLCRGGFFPAADEVGRRAAIEENRRAIEDAAALGTDVLVLVCGGLPDGSRDLVGARGMVADGNAAVLDDAAACGVRLGIEPLHPMFAADRSVITTLAEANDLASAFPEERVGVIVGAYHVWWDPCVEREIARARILGFHVDDWVLPVPEGALLGRGLPGEGLRGPAAPVPGGERGGVSGPCRGRGPQRARVGDGRGFGPRAAGGFPGLGARGGFENGGWVGRRVRSALERSKPGVTQSSSPYVN